MDKFEYYLITETQIKKFLKIPKSKQKNKMFNLEKERNNKIIYLCQKIKKDMTWKRPRGKENAEVQTTQNMGEESEIS